MDNKKIIDLAAQFDDDSPEFAMSQGAVIAFARALIKEERSRIKQIIDEIGRQGNHDKWFDCADAIAERVEECSK